MENFQSDLSQYINPKIHNIHYASGQPPNDKNDRVDTYKTVMCLQWLSSATCAFGPDCKFAHGEAELRPAKLPIRNTMKYKTKMCDKYTTTGVCPYGSRCLFIHPDPRNLMYPRQPEMSQKRLQRSYQTSILPYKAPMAPSTPTSLSSVSPYVTPPSSMAPSPPRSFLRQSPSFLHPRSSWPFEKDNVFGNNAHITDEPHELLNHSRSLPCSLPTSRHCSTSASPYSHETSGSISGGAWTLF